MPETAIKLRPWVRFVLNDASLALDIVAPRTLPFELVAAVQPQECRIVCIADLPPSAPSKARYVVRKLRAIGPDLTILAGRWAPPTLADDTVQPLTDAGADHVAAALLDTRDQLRQMVEHVLPDLSQGATLDAA